MIIPSSHRNSLSTELDRIRLRSPLVIDLENSWHNETFGEIFFTNGESVRCAKEPENLHIVIDYDKLRRIKGVAQGARTFSKHFVPAVAETLSYVAGGLVVLVTIADPEKSHLSKLFGIMRGIAIIASLAMPVGLVLFGLEAAIEIKSKLEQE
jgi:hypothetical protein